MVQHAAAKATFLLLLLLLLIIHRHLVDDSDDRENAKFLSFMCSPLSSITVDACDCIRGVEREWDWEGGYTNTITKRRLRAKSLAARGMEPAFILRLCFYVRR